jgi:hypothetical protein
MFELLRNERCRLHNEIQLDFEELSQYQLILSVYFGIKFLYIYLLIYVNRFVISPAVERCVGYAYRKG